MNMFTLFYFLCALFFLLWILVSRKRGQHGCYIMSYECYKPSDDRKLNAEVAGDLVRRNKSLELDEFMFLLKIMVNSGIGEETYAPRNFFLGREQSPCLSDGILEMEEFFYHTLDKLFSNSKLAISPKHIDILVVNVSTFSPAPSLSARIVNHYKMREDIKTFNLSGMGCSASLISLNLVQNLFKSHTNLLALVLTSESIAPNWYLGKDRSMMLPNLLFRSGGAAILLTNNPSLKHKAMFKLNHLIRSHLGGEGEAYYCVQQKEDEDGHLGVSLSKRLPNTAAKAISVNLGELAPKIVSKGELLRYVCATAAKNSKQKQYSSSAMINFKRGVDHFIIHTGGKEVIEGIGRHLGLSEYDLEPSKMTLHRFGNTSASSIWYVLAYMEAKNRLKKGDAILMINPGGGFKCNSCMLQVARDLEGRENVWKDCISEYPQPAENPFMDKYGWIKNVDPFTFKVLLQDDDFWNDCVAGRAAPINGIS